MTNLLILGSNISAPLWVGLITRHKEIGGIDVIFCTRSQAILLDRLNLESSIQVQCFTPGEHLRKSKDAVQRLRKFNPSHVYLLGQIDPVWFLSASQLACGLSFWEKGNRVDLDFLANFFNLEIKEVNKPIGTQPQVFLQFPKNRLSGRFFAQTKTFVINSGIFLDFTNLIVTALKERVFDRIFVTFDKDVPDFADRWAKKLPGAIVVGSGYGTSSLGSDGYEETWIKEIFSKIHVISEKDLSQYV